MLKSITSYDMYKLMKEKYPGEDIFGNINAFCIYNKKLWIKEHITQHKFENGDISPSRFAIRMKNVISKYQDCNRVEEIEYTIFKLILNDDYSGEEDHYINNGRVSYRKEILGTRKTTVFRKGKVISRIDGPAIIDTGYSNEKSVFYSEPKNIYVYQGLEVPDWVPKLSDGKFIVETSKVDILKSSLRFNAEYTATVVKIAEENNF